MLPEYRMMRRFVLLLFFGLAMAYSVVVPLGEAPDEVSHYAYVRWIATHWSLPEPEGAVLGEVFQPPYYYALLAPLTVWQPDEGIPVEANADWDLRDPLHRVRVLLQPPAARWPWRGEALAWHLVRFTSPLLGLVTVAATFGLARLVIPQQRWGALLAATFLAFLPQFTFQSSVLTNDNLVTMISSLVLLTLARALVRGEQQGPDPSTRLWLIAGILGGIGTWAKTSALVLAGTAGVAWLLTWGLAGRWRRTLALGGGWALVAAPLFLWNIARHGDPLGWSLMHAVTDERVGPLTLSILWETTQGLYRTFWVGFGGAAHLVLPPALNLLLGVPLLAGLLGLARFFRQGNAPVSSRLLIWLLVHVLLIGAAWIQWTRTVLGTGQGRLLFPALPAIAVLLAAGWGSLPGLRGRRGAIAGSVAWALFGIGVLLLYVRPLYHSPPLHVAPSESREAGWRFGEGLLLQAYSYREEQATLPPGATTSLYLEWQAREPLDDLRLHLQLVDEANQPVLSKVGTPSAGRDTTDQWIPGVTVGAWHRITIPAGTAPGWYRLMMTVRRASGEVLPLYGPEGNLWGEQVMVGQVTVMPPAPRDEGARRSLPEDTPVPDTARHLDRVEVFEQGYRIFPRRIEAVP